MKGLKNYKAAKELSGKIVAKKYNNKDEMMLWYKEFVRLTRKAAYAGIAEAQEDLAYCYDDFTYVSSDSPDYNPVKRNYWHTKACDNNMGTSCSQLGIAYENGEGCERNLVMSLEYFKRSAKLASSLGKNNYKIMLRQMQPGGRYYNELTAEQKREMKKIVEAE